MIAELRNTIPGESRSATKSTNSEKRCLRFQRWKTNDSQESAVILFFHVITIHARQLQTQTRPLCVCLSFSAFSPNITESFRYGTKQLLWDDANELICVLTWCWINAAGPVIGERMLSASFHYISFGSPFPMCSLNHVRSSPCDDRFSCQSILVARFRSLYQLPYYAYWYSANGHGKIEHSVFIGYQQ